MPDSCATDGDERATREKCGADFAVWDAVRSASGHGLLVRWKPSPSLGVGLAQYGLGHLLHAAYRLHALCIELGRTCHIDLYGTPLADYFGYADQRMSSWAADASTVREAYGRSPNTTRLVMEASALAADAPFIESRIRPAVLSLSTPLVEVVVRGHLPLYSVMESHRLGAVASLDGGPHAEQTPSVCLCRYVTQPRLHAARLAALRALAGRRCCSFALASRTPSTQRSAASGPPPRARPRG